MTCCFSSSTEPSTIVWSDEFTAFTGSQYPDYIYNARWGDCIYRWSNTRTLGANSDDQYWVTDGFNNGAGTVADALNVHGGYGAAPYLHVQAGSTLRLRTFQLTQAEANTYLYGYRYPSGAISDARPPLATSGQYYGTWTVRFRFNAIGQGQHFAIWLIPDDGAWPPEIDILEVVNGQSTWHCALHTPGGTGGDFLADFARPGGPNDWHIASFTLTPGLLTWKVNGSTVREQANTLEAKRWYINLTWEIGTTWTGDPDGTTPWPADVELDYVTLSA